MPPLTESMMFCEMRPGQGVILYQVVQSVNHMSMSAELKCSQPLTTVLKGSTVMEVEHIDSKGLVDTNFYSRVKINILTNSPAAM